MTAEARDLEERVAGAFLAVVARGSRTLLAVSGGGDSLALLALLERTRGVHQVALTVGHVDHGIASDAGAVATMVREHCREYGIEVRVARLGLAPDTSETRARTARRRALREIAGQIDASSITLAHHADDQAETVLLRALLGSGVPGLAAMRARRGVWVRPLLDIRRDELHRYLDERGITPWADPANSDPRHLRSWLRHVIVPEVERRIPGATPRLLRLGRHAARTRLAWDQARATLPGLDQQRESGRVSVAASLLRDYRSPLRHEILAALGRRIGVLVGERRCRAIDRLLFSARGTGTVDVGRCYRAELAFGRLVFLRVAPPVVDHVTLEPGAVRLGRARFAIAPGTASTPIRSGWGVSLAPGRYQARMWRAGDRIRPFGGSGSRAVAVLLREARIGVSVRRDWPVVTTADDATIVWVPGICRADIAVPEEGDEAWRVECAFT